MVEVNPFSPHKDVLEANVPSDDAGKTRLLEELKNRAKAAIQASCYPDSFALYQKGLQCALTSAETAILHANMSLCKGKMNQWKEAQEYALKATQEDSTYVKGFWRLGQALGNLEKYQEAVGALEKATSLEPSNKALQKEIEKYRAKAAEAPKEVPKPKTEVEKVVTTTTRSNGKKTVETKEEKMQVDEEEEEEKIFTKSDPVRGYKIVNGKKTSYFHNELSEEAKQLIGDIAPKKLDEAAVPAPVKTVEGTSAWNQAGTWEEKDVTQWAISSLEERLNAVSYVLPDSSPAPSATVVTTNAKVTGHASVATVRGKKRYIYEFCVKLNWKFNHEEVEASGKIAFPDVDGTCMLGEGYEESDFVVEDADTDSIRPILTNFVHKQGWREQVHECIDDWVRYFKDTY